MITRTPNRASSLAAQLETRGAIAISIPTIEMVAPDSYAPLDEALARLEEFDWIIFTSAHAVEVFNQRRNVDLAPPRIAVIGSATASAIEQAGLKVSLLPSSYVAESLAAALATQVARKRVLLIRAAEARDVLPESIRRDGGELTIVEAYRNRIPIDSIPLLRELFAAPSSFPDAITFTSASTVRNLIALLEAAGLTLPPKTVLASIGPITSQALRDLGFEPTVEASEATIPALVHAIHRHFVRTANAGEDDQTK